MNRRPNHPAAARRAFTLVELLVVIGIIALLISILLPSLNSARKSARSVACLSNLRTFGQTQNFYANDFDLQVPTGVMFNRHDWGYFAFASNRVGPWGAYIYAGLVPVGEVLYCPEQQTAYEAFLYERDGNDTADDNEWVEEPGNGPLRVGYDLRPDRIWSQWHDGYPIRGFDTNSFPSNPLPPAPMNKMTTLTQTALAADQIRRRPRHGVSGDGDEVRGSNNVLWGDGHAQSVPYDVIRESMENPTLNQRYLRPTEFNWSSGSFGSQQPFGAWADLDRFAQ
jgi:prepilin-type N-terminal cleavage/methylation domain-containing protein/prepilin-type processing-associated H-X9-DG protein